MATNIDLALTLDPVGYDQQWPEYYIKIDDAILTSGVLTQSRAMQFELTLAAGDHVLAVGFTNKANGDTMMEHDRVIRDRALIIADLVIEGYRSPKMLYSATYFPHDRPPRKGEYLSWNGEWRLPISMPIFTWIHRTQDLGWIYGENNFPAHAAAITKHG